MRRERRDKRQKTIWNRKRMKGKTEKPFVSTVQAPKSNNNVLDKSAVKSNSLQLKSCKKNSYQWRSIWFPIVSSFKVSWHILKPGSNFLNGLHFHRT